MRLSDKMPQRKISRPPNVAVNRETSRKPRREHSNEMEVKLRVTDRQALLRQLARLRARYRGAGARDEYAVRHARRRACRAAGKMVRIRVERPAWHERPRCDARDAECGPGEPRRHCLPSRARCAGTNKASRLAAGRYKIREEQEVRVADGDALARILGALGLRRPSVMRNIARPIGCQAWPASNWSWTRRPSAISWRWKGPRLAIDRAARPAWVISRPTTSPRVTARSFSIDGRRHRHLQNGGGLPVSEARDMLFRKRNEVRAAIRLVNYCVGCK